MVYLELIFPTNGKDTEEFIMKLPKQSKPVMRNRIHRGQINSGVIPSGDLCCCPGATRCTGTCTNNNGVLSCDQCE